MFRANPYTSAGAPACGVTEAVGTDKATATPIVYDFTELMAPPGGGAAVMPLAITGACIGIDNVSANDVALYAFGGDIIDENTADVAYAMRSYTMAIFVCGRQGIWRSMRGA
jgi:hypothetical protein